MSLLSKYRERQKPTEAEQEHHAILDDIPGWYRDCLGLRVAPPSKLLDAKGDPVGWVDMQHGSAYLRRIAFWRSTWEIHKKTGAFIFMDMEPRWSGKSIVMLAEVARLITADRSFLVGYGAQNADQATKRARWFDHAFTSPDLINRFGPFKGKGTGLKWSAEEKYILGSKHKDQPNIRIFSPGGSVTGAHPGLWVLDDMVDRRNSRSFALQEHVLASWGDVLQTCSTDTMIWIIGTPWPGVYHLYDMIADKYGSNAVIRYVPSFGPATNEKGKVLFSVPGKQNYPWISEAFLSRQRELLPEHEYIGAYEVKRAHAKQLFKLASFVQEEPPKTNNEPLAPYNLKRENGLVYMVTDPANNEGNTRGLSKAAIAVFIKYSDGHSYILDMRLEHMTSDIFLDEFEQLVEAWGPIEHYTMENQGPGNMYPGWIEERYERAGKEAPVIRAVSRSYSGRKEDRIMSLYQPLSEGKLSFAPTIQPYVICWQDHSAIPLGVLAEEAARFNPNGNKESLDGLDCLADVYWQDKDGPLCPPPDFKIHHKELTADEMRLQMRRDMIAEWRDNPTGAGAFQYR